ncbi:hypothetical protein NPIL_382741 [Nephila pilipes]|uniref:Uncharacterized protein n=1 Tax=Nephila pilipes TaxID=299642 RepID=A0A8X6QK11_NEPPI|nr:hypothetical protein NPIL_382741 [Nephila pilipes]
MGPKRLQIRSILIEDDVITYFMNLKLKKALLLTSDAWVAVKSESITACWDKALRNLFEQEPIKDTDTEDQVAVQGFEDENFRKSRGGGGRNRADIT